MKMEATGLKAYSISDTPKAKCPLCGFDSEARFQDTYSLTWELGCGTWFSFTEWPNWRSAFRPIGKGRVAFTSPACIEIRKLKATIQEMETK